MRFYVLDSLGKFDLILGIDGLRKIHAIIDLMSFELSYVKKTRFQAMHYTIESDIDQTIIRTIEQLINANNDTPILPFNTRVEATIRTKNDDPIWTKQYPYPNSCFAFVTREIEKLLRDGIIRISYSPYNAPIWVVPKKGFNEDGTPNQRLVIDFKKLNMNTIFDRYPMSDINIILSNLGEAQFFSKIDLESGFHQILIKESDKEKTAFSVNGAKYEFNRMPFGLKNAPSIFQRAIDDIIRPFIGKFAYVYMDDILIFSKTKEEHFDHIKAIIQAITDANMKISSKKSHFFATKTEFLGHVIFHNRITVDEKKVETIKNYPVPITLKELRSFLGLSGYYRKFIYHYAHITKPLTVHLRSDNGRIGAKLSSKIKIDLDTCAIGAFNTIKSKLQEQIELFQPDYSKPFELTTDASNFAIGAVLSQNQKPIIFISRTLNNAEQIYATNEKELLAIVWSLKTLRNYLYGIAEFTIFTDHQPLTSAISDKNPNLKIKRWKAFIEESGANIEYTSGKQNVVADALSRQSFFSFNE